MCMAARYVRTLASLASLYHVVTCTLGILYRLLGVSVTEGEKGIGRFGVGFRE